MRLVVGLVRGVHGLNGAVRVEVLTDRPEVRFGQGARLFREGETVPLTVTDAVDIPDGPGWRLRFREVPDRTAAERLRGAYLEAEVAAGEALDRGSFYWHEIVGLTVHGLDGEELGTVADVYRVAENDVYVVRGGARGEFDVPAVRDFVRVLAPRRGELVVDAAALELGPPRAPRTPRPPRPRKGQPRPPSVSEAARPDEPPVTSGETASSVATGTGAADAADGSA
jgi:16S rRNA processing protein RimM